jgi:hypothetical protein
MTNEGMKYTDDTTIPIRMAILFILVGMDHEVRMRPRIQGILRAAQIVRSIIDTKNFVLVQSVVDERHIPTFLVREGVLIALVGTT